MIRNISKAACAAAALAVLLAGCSFKNKSEKEADKITHAVIANNMDPVMKDFDSQLRAQITPIIIAQLSTELREQGAYKNIKEVALRPNATPGEHDFEATFERHVYTEQMVLDDDGHVRAWHIHMKDSTVTPGATP